MIIKTKTYYIVLLLLFAITYGVSQNYNDNSNDETVIEYRGFKENLKEKYNSPEFIYNENIVAPKVIEAPSESWWDKFKPYIGQFLIVIVCLAALFFIIKAIVDGKIHALFGSSGDKKIKSIELNNVDIDTKENDINTLLNNAIAKEDYRSAVRYYYLIALKKMGSKNIIKLHKDKTNTDYIFEIKDSGKQKKFSDIAYIYDYIWYGEFPIDSFKFKTIEQTFKNHIKTI